MNAGETKNTVKSTNKRHKHLNIMIVEDDKYMNEALCDVLESEGYNVDSSTDAPNAVDMLKNTGKNYDLLIVDYNLQHFGGMTGLDVYEIAKNVNPASKGVMISAYGRNKNLREKALEKGIAVFLDKPFLISELIDSVEGLRGENEVKNRSKGKLKENLKDNSDSRTQFNHI